MTQFLAVDEGVEHIQSKIPEVVEAKSTDVKVVDLNPSGMKLSVVGHGQLSLKKAGCKRLRATTSADLGMMCALSEESQAHCWSELMQRFGGDLRFKVREGEVVAVGSSAAGSINYRGFLDRFVTRFQPIGFSNIVSRRDHVAFGLVTNRTQEPPKRVGDVVHEGIYVSFNGKVLAQPYNMRLVCTNGMLRSRRSGASVVTVENFDEVMADLVVRADQFTRDYVNLADRPLEDGGGIVGRLSSQRYLNSVQVRQITERLAQLEDNATEYDLVNLITVMQHERPGDSSWLVAGGLAVGHLHDEHCSRCGAHV